MCYAESAFGENQFGTSLVIASPLGGAMTAAVWWAPSWVFTKHSKGPSHGMLEFDRRAAVDRDVQRDTESGF